MRFIGDTEALSADVQEAIRRSEKPRRTNTGLTLQIAVNYSSRWEITRMAQRVAAEAVRGGLKVEDITPEVISGHLVTAGVPDPDLLIRTSGEPPAELIFCCGNCHTASSILPMFTGRISTSKSLPGRSKITSNVSADTDY